MALRTPWKAEHGALRKDFPTTIDWISDAHGNQVVHWSGFDASDLVTKDREKAAKIMAAAPEMLRVCKLVVAALEVGNGINRRSQPIGDKTYISQLKAAIAVAEK